MAYFSMSCTHRTLLLAVVVAWISLLSACGGGGSGSTAPAQTVARLPPGAAKASDPNAVIVTVAQGPGSNVNIPYVSVTLCVPGTSTCKTIDNVLLDTGSTGLRIFSSALASGSALNLPAHSVAAGSTVSACAHFLSAVAWGAVQVADVRLGQKIALSVPVQSMGTTSPPASCGGSRQMAPPSYTATSSYFPLSANGILGVSQYVNDGQRYFSCTGTSAASCTAISGMPVAQQVQNPVALFSSDNNGVVVQMPSLVATGASSAEGLLVFGVETQENNRLGAANVVALNSSGYFNTTYQGRTYTQSFIDSGSNGLYFDDAITACTRTDSDFYCPASTLGLSAQIALASGTATVNFSVANAESLFSGNSFAFNNLGGRLNSSRSFDWGLPFFFGRSVYTVIEGNNVAGYTGPFYAFTNPAN